MATVRFAVCNEMFQGWEIADVFRHRRWQQLSERIPDEGSNQHERRCVSEPLELLSLLTSGPAHSCEQGCDGQDRNHQ